MPKLKGKNPVLIPNSLSILLIYKPSNFLGPLQTMRQEYFSKEKRFNTFFINLIYNKGEGNLLKQNLLDSIYKRIYKQQSCELSHSLNSSVIVFSNDLLSLNGKSVAKSQLIIPFSFCSFA